MLPHVSDHGIFVFKLLSAKSTKLFLLYNMSLLMDFKLVMVAELSSTKVAIERDVKKVDCFLMSLKVCFSQKFLLAFFAFMILSILMKNDMVL